MIVTANEFRRLALSLPEAKESAHMNHPDFRVRGRIFATLSPPDENWGMVKLPPLQQMLFVQAEPEVFAPFKGAWGRHGATKVHLRVAKKATVRKALVAAWRNTAPKSLAEEWDIE
jgi:hypothetical protein